MAYEELASSQKLHVTADGVSFLRVFQVDWADWNDGTFPYFVGKALDDVTGVPLAEQFTVNPYGLYVTDMITVPAVGNTRAGVEVMYSNDLSRTTPRQEPNQAGSIEETFDVRTEEVEIESYFVRRQGLVISNSASSDITVGDQKFWPVLYSEFGFNSSSAASTPPLVVTNRTMSFQLTAYSSKLWIKRIMETLNTINDGKFMHPYLTFTQASGIQTEPQLQEFDDTGLWLFASCPITRVRFDSWRYDMTFLFNNNTMSPSYLKSNPPATKISQRQGWNINAGIFTGVYPEADHIDLLQDMLEESVVENPGTGR